MYFKQPRDLRAAASESRNDYQSWWCRASPYVDTTPGHIMGNGETLFDMVRSSHPVRSVITVFTEVEGVQVIWQIEKFTDLKKVLFSSSPTSPGDMNAPLSTDRSVLL